MAKYIKTAVTDAEQFDGSQQLVDKYDIMVGSTMPDSRVLEPSLCYIQTLEGNLRIHVGDWIATGVNGYTMAKEKKYLVYKKLGGKHTADVQYAQAYLTSVHSKILWILTSWILTGEDTDESFFQFTESEIEHYGLQDCERMESD